VLRWFEGWRYAIPIFPLNGNRHAPASYALELGPLCDAAARVTGCQERDTMSVPPPGRLSLVLEAERIDPGDTAQYRYHIVPRRADMAPAVNRM
jgi:hypothetical protein